MDRTKRKEASRVIAFVLHTKEIPWPGLADAVMQVAKMLDIPSPWRGRSIVAIECLDKLRAAGIVVPADFVVPWEMPDRGGYRRTKERWSPQRMGI